VNPILYKEGIDRFRGKRVWPFLLMWIMFNGGVTYLLFLLAATINDQGFGLLFGRTRVGPFVFHGALVLLLLGIIMFLPGLAAVGIVGERERQTMRLLQLTSLSPVEIVIGKLAAALSYIGWLLLALLPVVSAPLILGGVTMGDIFAALVMLGLIALVIGSISTWLSARAKSTRSAVSGSYVLTFALLFFTPLLGVGEAYLQTNQFERPLHTELWTAIPNPYLALVSAVAHPLELDQERWRTVFYPGYTVLLGREGLSDRFQVDRSEIVVRDSRRFVASDRPPVWAFSGIFYLAVIALSIRRAARWVSTPAPAEFAVKRAGRSPG
jgi:ABC-type transport system involved in multi-copper enzyme maturation permease subunit